MSHRVFRNDRRTWLQSAGATVCGATMFGAAATGLSGPASAEPVSTKRSCIFIWLNGGPSQFETFDPKPLATANVRGPFGTIQTAVPGLFLSELVPQLARRADRLCLLRSLTHGNSNHDSKAMLTGSDASSIAFGAAVTHLLGTSGSMPAYVHIGSSTGDGSQFGSSIDQVGGGDLGPVFNPLRVRAPGTSQVRLGDFALREGVTRDLFDRRLQLLTDLQTAATDQSAAFRRHAAEQRRAADILTSTRVRDAFDLAAEPADLRARYGANFFGQSCLLARRLVEAGTRFVQIKWYDVVAFDAWDTHGADLPGMRRMEQQLCPRLDQGLAALLDDLAARGLLASTLLVVVGEFGRTPQLNKNGDRDHWSSCFSALLAGAGVPAGTAVGASDDSGAYPSRLPVSPQDFAATLFHRLGLNLALDPRVRRFVPNGIPVSELIA